MRPKGAQINSGLFISFPDLRGIHGRPCMIKPYCLLLKLVYPKDIQVDTMKILHIVVKYDAASIFILNALTDLVMWNN